MRLRRAQVNPELKIGALNLGGLLLCAEAYSGCSPELATKYPGRVRRPLLEEEMGSRADTHALTQV